MLKLLKEITGEVPPHRFRPVLAKTPATQSSNLTTRRITVLRKGLRSFWMPYGNSRKMENSRPILRPGKTFMPTFGSTFRS